MTTYAERFVMDHPVEIIDDGNDEDVTAAAEVHTGAMIALVPSADDAGRLAVPGGLPADELHCTIKYLGEAADITAENQDEILRRIEATATALDVIDAEGFALALFNPQGYSQDREPCTVLLISGEELSEAYEFICHMVRDVIDESYSHMPWVPHITLSETGDADLTPLVDQVGPVTFDRIRVAFAGENYDFPLESEQSGTERSELETSEPPQMTEQEPADGSYTAVFDLDHPDVQGWLNEYIAWAKERGIKSPGGVGHQLRDYWVHGPGAAKIRWNTEGDGTRCIKHLRKYVGVRAGGLCQEYHQLATGTVMGRHPGRPTEGSTGDVIPFGFNKDEPRDSIGRWTDSPGKKGIRAIEHADKYGGQPRKYEGLDPKMTPRHWGDSPNNVTPDGMKAIHNQAIDDKTSADPNWNTRSAPFKQDAPSDALGDYAGGTVGQKVNDMLRDPTDYRHQSIHGEDFTIRTADYIPRLDAAMYELPQPVTTYRTVDKNAFGASSVDDLKKLVGKQVFEPGYMSTSISPEQKVGVDRVGDVHLKIEVPKGHKAFYMRPVSDWPDEEELLLQRGTTLEITGVDIKKGRAFVNARVVQS